MTAALTPYDWSVKELTEARVAFICALMGNMQRAAEHLDTLPQDARDDLAIQAGVFAALARAKAGRSLIRVPCGRCGHDENIHETVVGRAVCIDCKGYCSPRLVPVGVVQTVTVTDGETEVE